MARDEDNFKAGVDFEWVTAKNGNYKTRRFFTRAEKEAMKADKAAPAPKPTAKPANRPAGSNRPKPRPKSPLTVEPVTTTRLGPMGGRGDGGAERIRRAADAAIARAEKSAPRASTGGPARHPRKPAAKTETPADRTERARQEAAERRANTRRQAGIGATPAKPAKPAAKPAGRNVLQNIGEFLRGGGYAGYRARQNKKDK